MDRELLAQTLADRGEPAYRARQVWEWLARGAGSYGEMTTCPRRCAPSLDEHVPLSTLTLDREERASDGTVKALLRTAARPARRGGDDALPRRPALAVPVVAVGLPADVHVLRDRADALRRQPQRRRDPRPGAALPPPLGRSTTPSSWAWASR